MSFRTPFGTRDEQEWEGSERGRGRNTWSCEGLRRLHLTRHNNTVRSAATDSCPAQTSLSSPRPLRMRARTSFIDYSRCLWPLLATPMYPTWDGGRWQEARAGACEQIGSRTDEFPVFNEVPSKWLGVRRGRSGIDKPGDNVYPHVKV